MKGELTPTQARTGRTLLDLLKEATTGHLLIALTGLSGLGKDFLLSRISPEIEQLNGKVYTERDLFPPASSLFKHPESQHVVLSVTPSELWKIRRDTEEKLTGFDLMILDMKGMSLSEMESYLEDQELEDPVVSKPTLARLSFGLPLLIDRIQGFARDEAGARKIALEHLAQSRFGIDEQPKSFYERFLQILPDPDELKELEQMRMMSAWTEIYRPVMNIGGLTNVLRGLQEVEASTGKPEESPIFVAPESEGLYGKIIQNRNEVNAIYFLIPSLRDDDLARIESTFGEWGIHHRNSRLHAFGADMRKVALWKQGLDGSAHITEVADRSQFRHTAECYYRQYYEGKIPTEPNNGYWNLFIDTHEHPEKHNPALVGWMLESLLQNRGIYYLADSYRLENPYVYLPSVRRIQTIPSLDRY